MFEVSMLMKSSSSKKREFCQTREKQRKKLCFEKNKNKKSPEKKKKWPKKNKKQKKNSTFVCFLDLSYFSLQPINESCAQHNLILILLSLQNEHTYNLMIND